MYNILNKFKYYLYNVNLIFIKNMVNINMDF